MRQFTSVSVYIGFLFTAMFWMSSCANEGIIEETPRVTLPESQELVFTNLYGRVLDAQGNPLSGAEVVYRNGRNPEQVLTEDDGSFLIKDVQNKGKAAFISVQSPGHFEAFRRYSVLPDRYNYTEIQMKSYDIIGSISASEGGNLTSADDAEISLPAGGIIDGNGTTYIGQVDVAMAWIDPTSSDLAREMVGDLSGLDMEGNVRALITHGMLQIELIGENGQELNIASGFEAELMFPIPTGIRGQAKPSVPLWSYNENAGTWIEEGSAVLDGNHYVGSVSHFSSWNVDFMTDPIEITGEVIAKNAEEKVGAGYFQVFVCSERINRKGGWLCDDGSFRFYNFPKDEEFKLKIIDRCGETIYEETYGPYAEDQVIPTIELEASTNKSVVFGNLLNCQDEAVTNGFVSVRQGDLAFEYPIDSLGNFEFVYDFCSSQSATFKGFDLDSLLTKEEEIISQEPEIDLSDYRLCEEVEYFIRVILEGKLPVVFVENIKVESIRETVNGEQEDITLIYSYFSEGSDSLIFREGEPFIMFFEEKVNDVGVYPATVAFLDWDTTSPNQEPTGICGTLGNVPVEITEYSEAGEGVIAGFVDMQTWNCTYTSEPGGNEIFSVDFRLKLN